MICLGTDGEIMERNKYGRKRCRNNADEQKNSGKKRKNKPGAGIMPGMSVKNESVHYALCIIMLTITVCV